VISSLRRAVLLSAALAVPPGTAAWAQSLQEALAAAYANNPALLAARAQLRAVDENVPQALAGWRPTVVLGAAAGYADTTSRNQATVPVQRDFAGNVRNPDTAGQPFSLFTDVPRNTANVTATVTQPLYRGGRTTAATRRAENQVYAQRSRLLGTEQQILLESVASYVAVIRDQEEVRLNTNNVQVLQRQLQATNERFRVGEITRTDVAQAEARLAQARFLLDQAQGQPAVLPRGVPAADRHRAARVSAPAPLALPVRSRQEAVRLATDNNPAVVAALFDEQAARDNIDLQFGALLPQVSAAGAGLPDRQQRRARLPPDGTAGDGDGDGAVVPGRRRACAGPPGAAAGAAGPPGGAGRPPAAAQQSAQAWETLGSARAQVESVRAQIRAQEIALDGVQREAVVGSRTTLDVLNAEQELLNARVQLVRSLATLINASYALAATIGRLTAQDLGLPVQIYDPRAYYNAVRDRWVGTGDYSGVATPAPPAGAVQVQSLAPVAPTPQTQARTRP
jgi:outer membrane protein